MGSSNSNGRNQGPDRRRGDKGQRRRGFPNVESLEGRVLLDGGANGWHPTSTDLKDVRNGPMANEGQDLINIYQEYLKQPTNTTALPAKFSYIRFQGNSVGIDVKGQGDFNTFLTSLRNLGMQVTASSEKYALAEGYIPISQLPTLARLPQTISASPMYKPVVSATPTPPSKVPYKGTAFNEALQSLNADTARQQTGLDGSGVTVGVLSDSADLFQGGLAASKQTGDLPASASVLTGLDGPAGSSDEGRAMMENIYDIAPGATLKFASAFNGNLSFANNIRALAQAGASVIVDDVTYMDEPMFQDGIIAQGVNDVVTQNNVAYFSSAANSSTNNGYLSTFRGVQATVGAIGSGRFMNFAPSGAPVTQLPITVSTANTVLTMQFDQPFFTQQPTGSTNDVTSEVDFYVLDASGNIVASGTQNNMAVHEPIQTLQIPNAGSYFVAIQVKSGPDPGHVQFVRWNDGPDDALQVSTQFGNAGGTYYPSSFGHNAGPNTIGVGAVPWWASQPFLSTNPLKSEGFSSSGPSLSVRNPDGSLKTGTITPTLNPSISGPDGGNTSFFTPPAIDTSNPPFPGQPATPTNLSQDLPSFFGTSSAAPNVAAVAVLMKQRNPALTNEQIRSALQAGARPLNASAAGAWDAQGGYGLVDAVSALSAADVLRVSTTTPAPGASVTTTPTQIVVTFSRPVDISTLRPADLAFVTVPSTLTNMSVGQPIGLDDPKFPTQVAFPFVFTVAANKVANGTFTYRIENPVGGPVILSKDGKPFEQTFNSSFNLADTTAPRVSNVTFNGRIVTVKFSEAMAPNTITPFTVFLARTDQNARVQTILNNDPRFKMSYDVNTATVTLDYTGLDQTQFPAGYYKLIVRAGIWNDQTQQYEVGVTDLAGNKLDGAFTGVFPSGNGNPLPKADNNFNYFLGFQNLAAPVITSLNLLPQFDSGIKGDENTNSTQPVFVGQVSAGFPGTVAGLTVLAEFSSLHNGNLDLAPLNGRGYTGQYDVAVTTDANGTFRITAPALFEGFQRVRLVVIGQPDSPPLPGLSTSFDHAFRVDKTAPTVVSATLTPGGAPLPQSGQTALNSLTTLSLNVRDPMNPVTGALATPAQVYFPALDPATASNISNYTLINSNDPDKDKSRFITSATFTSTGADFVSAPNRVTTADPFSGRIDLSFAPGLSKGHYTLTVHTRETDSQTKVSYGGLTDSAGNPLGSSFTIEFDIQPESVYVTSVSSDVANAQGNTLLPQSYYEINPRAGDIVSAPPTKFYIDFSNPLDPTKDYSDAIQLIRTADSAAGAPDGDFGTLGVAGLGSTGNGFSRFNPAGTTVSLASNAAGIPNTRLVLQLPAGTVLPADHYRLYMPNTGAGAIKDIYGNQLDGEFLGNPAASGVDRNGNPAYEDLLPTGKYRPGMSGDGVAGGAFTTGFIVVPTGNLVYARPDYFEDALLPDTASDGSISKPYSVLAPQAAPNANNSATLNNGDPNGGLNSAVNFLGGFDPTYDRAGINRFARSAFYAAQQLSMRGPVVIVALPGTPQRDPSTGLTTQKTFVLQAPSGSDPIKNDGSASVPFNTALVFNPGSSLKMQNASLFVQNQGSSLQTLGGINPNQRVNITSYADDSVGGDTNGNGSNTSPRAGDYGGVVFRNFQQLGRPNTFPVDITLKQGPNGAPAVSGADDVLSSLNFVNISYGGGAVPATQGTRYDEVTLYNSRPAITNATIIGGSGGGSQAAISGDLDSFREDDIARGPLIRRTTVAQTSINGIWVRPQLASGVAQATDAIPYVDNPVTLGGVRNYTFDDPLPYVLTSVLNIGTQGVVTNVGQTLSVHNRLYVQPGMMVKSEPGAGIRILTAGSSMIVGDRTYINNWDAAATIDPNTGLPISTYSPQSSNFKPNTTGDARVVFTTALDNTSTTSYFDPISQTSTVIVPAIDTLNTNGVGQPSPGNVPGSSRWGYINYTSGAYGTFDEADLRYGGGALNIPGGTATQPGVLNFINAFSGLGTRLMVTNNNFFDNADVPMSIEPNGLLAADTLRPLSSGHPYFRGNVFQRNTGANGLLVKGSNPGDRQRGNVDFNSLWDSTDLTYIVRNSIVMGGPGRLGNGIPPTSLQAEPKPAVVLTVQSALPGTLLPDGSSIPRPGESVIIKLDNSGNPAPSPTTTQTPNVTTEDFGGAGFLSGVDNGVDSNDFITDVGAYSQMRFLGIGGNETTGQQRVPVVITSIHDSTVGTTVRGVKLFTAKDGDTTAPQKGDGGLIYFGGNGLTDYNVLDPRDGSLIDNADIRYITRIEMQGGGIVDYNDLNASNSFDKDDNPYATKGGAFPPLPNGQPNPLSYTVQRNGEHTLMISNSNLSSFLDAGVIAHPGFFAIAGGLRSSIAGQPNMLVMMNNTIANMPIGVQMIGDPNADAAFPEANEFLALNNTFYNNPIAVDLQAIQFNTSTPQTLSHIHFVAMDNIFQGSATAVVRGAGMLDGSQMQYNLFWNNGPAWLQNDALPPSHFGAIPNLNPVNGDPKLRDPANGNFQLSPGSAAIDAARSELNLNPSTAPDWWASIITSLLPVVNQTLDGTTGIRNQTTRVPDGFGQLDPTNPPTDQLTLPGYVDRGYIDLWVPTLATDSQGIPGPTTVPGSWVYKPALIPPGTKGVPGGGERDALGYLRVDDPSQRNTGFGSRPFFDIGAFEYRALFPPHVTDVKATVTDPANPSAPAATIPLYKVGSFAGTNKALQTIQVSFDHNIDPNTINGSTVLLQASGGDGIFGNNNTADDKFYNLSGKVSFDSATNILTINVGAAGLVLKSDEYRLTLLGGGTEVIRDPQGNALDGENTAGGDPNGAQLALPSGDGFPGGNFFTTFVINTQAPSIVLGSFRLDPSTDTNVVGDRVTSNNKPAFSGTITVPQPQIVPLAGQTVYLDVSTRGNGVFDYLNAGTALTDANGRFLVTVGQDGAGTGLVIGNGLPDSPYSVGPDGLLGTGDDTGYTQFRIRVVDQSGNVSNLPSDSLESFFGKGATTTAVIDTAPPKITSLSPAPGTQIAPGSDGKVTFTLVIDKNIDPNTVNADTILVTRAGPDGVLGTKDDVSVPIDSGVNISGLGGTAKGPARVIFTISGALPNDLYQVTIKGAGTTALTDIAGNALDGLFNGTFPTGQDNKPGSDFTAVYGLFRANAASLKFVGQASDITNPGAPKGDRSNPYLVIGNAIKAAAAGDVIAVLPGVYTENVALKPFIRLISAAPSSTNSLLVNGNALNTIIRAPSGGSSGENITVSAANLPSIPGIDTEISGLTIASPLLGDPALGIIDPNATAIDVRNSDVLIDRSYVIDAHNGIRVTTSGSTAPTPRIINVVVAGNDNGIVLEDKGAASIPRLTQIVNDTIAFNTIGVKAISASNSLMLGNIVNSIVWQNHDLTAQRNGTGISSQFPGKLVVRSTLFSGNGPNDLSPIDDAVNVGGGFVPGNLNGTPDGFGNFVGAPAFVAPRDPRPGSDGPATFFIDANFDLTRGSAAIDAANNAAAPTTDFLYRNRVTVTGRGFPGTGPADLGAFEFQATGGSGSPVGGTFRVATSSLSPDGSAVGNGAISYSSSAPPKSVTVTFSDNVDPSSVQASDLVLWGDGLNPVGPARATSLSWVDSHTVRFNLSSGFSNQGSVSVRIDPGTIKSVGGSSVASFKDFFRIKPVAPGSPGISAASVSTAANTASTPAVVPTATPAPSTITSSSVKSPALTQLSNFAPPAPLVPAANPTTPPALHRPFFRLPLRRLGKRR